MHRTTADGCTVDNKFQDGDPQSGTPATLVQSAELNVWQEELANLVEGAGLTLDAENDGQVLEAVQTLIEDAQPLAPICLPYDVWWESTNYGSDVELGSTAGRKVPAMKLANGSTQGFGAEFILPDATKDYQFGFKAAQSTSESSKAVVFKCEIQIVPAGEDPAQNNADVSSTQTISTRTDTGLLITENSNFRILAASRHANHDLARVRLERIGGDGSDTHTGDTYIHGIYMVEA